MTKLKKWYNRKMEHIEQEKNTQQEELKGSEWLDIDNYLRVLAPDLYLLFQPMARAHNSIHLPADYRLIADIIENLAHCLTKVYL